MERAVKKAVMYNIWYPGWRWKSTLNLLTPDVTLPGVLLLRNLMVANVTRQFSGLKLSAITVTVHWQPLSHGLHQRRRFTCVPLYAW